MKLLWLLCAQGWQLQTGLQACHCRTQCFPVSMSDVVCHSHAICLRRREKALHMQDCYEKAYPPDRSNIFIDLAPRRPLVSDRDLGWLVSGLRAKKSDYPKTLVYGRSINCITELYTHGFLAASNKMRSLSLQSTTVRSAGRLPCTPIRRTAADNNDRIQENKTQQFEWSCPLLRLALVLRQQTSAK